ncbi:MAG: DNA mismatch repair protein MutS, partial [Eubacteriales bacterium]|nr:DNA mismatch repair protein MutS [Eubacteriales bacterium]
MPLRFRDLNPSALSPMMQQYYAIKESYADCVLLFRLGDFYEAFFDDALIASEVLEIALTSRDCGLEERAPMCGVPFHAFKPYVARLVEAGHKVAICEQVEDPAQAKGIVRREVTEVITAGTVCDPDQLAEDRNHYLLAVYCEGPVYALAAVELISGQFFALDFSNRFAEREVLDAILRYQAHEVLANAAFFDSPLAKHPALQNLGFSLRPDSDFDASQYPELLAKGDRLTIEAQTALKSAAALLSYIILTRKAVPEHLSELQFIEEKRYMLLSENSRRNLELFETLRDKKKHGSLLSVLDHCKTAAGKRLLRQWLERPLLDIDEIRARSTTVAYLKSAFITRMNLREALAGLYDIERLVGKLALNRSNPRDLLALAQSLEKIPALKHCLSEAAALPTYLKEILESLSELPELRDELQRAIDEDAPIQITEGGLIRDGYHQQIDHFRSISRNAQGFLRALEESERDQTGIKTLKISYNRVFGYYIEVSRANAKLVPEHYERKQTLANAERYFTPELKKLEDEIRGAEGKIAALEYECFIVLRELAGKHIRLLQHNAKLLATLDVLQSLAEIASIANYVEAELSSDSSLEITAGRHPVVERLQSRQRFIANDSHFDNDSERMILLTGPNMSGKSTYM